MAAETYDHVFIADRRFPEPTPPDKLTPSEVALAKILAAAVEWRWQIGEGDPGVIVRNFVTDLYRSGHVNGDGTPTTLGSILLARARKAGVL